MHGGYGPPPGPYAPPVAYAPVHPGVGPPLNQPTAQDVSNLKTLSICTIIYGVLIALLSAFGLIYVVIGIAIATDARPTSPTDPDPAVVGATFAIIGMLATVLIAAKGALLIASGIGMSRRKWRVVSFVAAGLSCLNMPLGTILGVFTFMVLNRPSVRALYEA